MSRPRTVEQQILTKADARTNAFCHQFAERDHEARVQVLETVSEPSSAGSQ